MNTDISHHQGTKTQRTASALPSALRERLGETPVAEESQILSAHAVGALAPKVVVFPESTSQTALALQAANELHSPVLLWGGGTSMALGNPPTGLEAVVDMTRLNQVISHDVDNLTVTVQTGMRLAQLQEVLRGKGQFLPLNPPGAEAATLGGIVAANVSGPWRLFFGAARDLVLGMKIALADGRIVSFGGKTVKNVAGYDMGKLFIGSLGTLGAICEITFRVYALPEESRTLLLTAPTAAEAFAAARQALSWQPAAAQVLEPRAANLIGGDGWLVAVDLMGDRAVVEKQAQEILSVDSCQGTAIRGEERLRLWSAIIGLTRARTAEAVVCRVNLPPAAVEEWAGRWAALNGTPSGHLVACPGTGRAWAHLLLKSAETAVEVVKPLREEAVRLGGNLVVEAAPEAWKPGLDVWGPPPLRLRSGQAADMTLLRSIKRTFDPSAVLSPGRFVGGM